MKDTMDKVEVMFEGRIQFAAIVEDVRFGEWLAKLDDGRDVIVEEFGNSFEVVEVL